MHFTYIHARVQCKNQNIFCTKTWPFNSLCNDLCSLIKPYITHQNLRREHMCGHWIVHWKTYDGQGGMCLMGGQCVCELTVKPGICVTADSQIDK